MTESYLKEMVARERLRRKPITSLLPGLSLVGLLGLSTSAGINRFVYTEVWMQCRFGVSTGQIERGFSLRGVHLFTYLEGTGLTKVIRKQSGKVPRESSWVYTGEGPLDVAYTYERWPLGYELSSESDDFCSVLENDDPCCGLALRYGFRGLQGLPGKDAERKAVAGFIQSLHASAMAQDRRPAANYIRAVVAATSYLDRPPTADDIPEYGEVADSQVWKARWEAEYIARRDTWKRAHCRDSLP